MLAVNALLIAIPLSLYLKLYISYDLFIDIFNAIISLSFLITVILYLAIHKKVGFREMPGILGIGKGSISPRIILLGLLLFFVVETFAMIVIAYNHITSSNLSSNVSQVFGGAPIWFVLFSSIIAPIDEEVLFRAFLVPRLGIVISAAMFAVAHSGYGSIIEIGVALLFGIVAGFIFKKTKSLYPSLIAHVLVNATTLIIFPLLL